MPRIAESPTRRLQRHRGKQGAGGEGYPVEARKRCAGGAMDERRIQLEVAIGSVDDALAAERGSADRLELNSALELGGLTPSLGSLIEVRQAVSLPVMVMI